MYILVSGISEVKRTTQHCVISSFMPYCAMLSISLTLSSHYVVLCFTGSAENHRQFEEAMKHGHIKAAISKVLMYGAAGSGKTSTKEIIVGNPPPAERTTTKLAERPMSICRINLQGDDFTTISSLQERRAFLARALIIAKRESKRSHQSEEVSVSANKPVATAAMYKVESIDQVPVDHGKHASDDQPPTVSLKVARFDDVIADEAVESQVNDILESISTNEELVKLMDHISTTVSPLTFFRLIQIVDCGGQSQFHEIIPIFLRNLSHYIFVCRLCDDLDKRPISEFFASDKRFGSPFVCAQSLAQLLQHCVRSIHSHQPSIDANRPSIDSKQPSIDSQQPSINSQRPSIDSQQPSINLQRPSTGIDPDLSKVMVVGTHLDHIKISSESLEVKNKKILKILAPLEKEQVIYHNLSKNMVVFPINAKNPGKSEEAIVKQIREVLFSDESMKPAEIPSSWFAFEILLEEMARAHQRGVLSKDECITAAIEKLHFEEAAVETALQYLRKLSVLFYFPEILPEVVFADPQVIIDKVSELVFKSAETDELSKSHALSGEWKIFHEWGLVTVKFLSKEFTSHFVPGLFEVDDLVKLFKKLLIFATFSSTQLFVPALLRNMSNKDVDKHRVSSIPSLVLLFPGGGPRHGIFCALLCWLASSDNDSPSPWCISTNADKSPKCLYRNCVKFKFPKAGAVITLIDTYSHFEVHVNISSSRVDDLCPKIFPKVRSAIFKGVRKATSNIGYENSAPTAALVCPCGVSEAHIAEADLEYGWTCTLDDDVSGELTPHQRLWIESPSTAASTSHKYLSESDLPMLLSKLNNHATKWIDIGMYLGFQHGELENIQAKPFLLFGAPQSYLGAMLTDWLHRAPSDRKGGPTIDNLIFAVRQSGLGAINF